MGLKAVSVITDVNWGTPVQRTLSLARAYQATNPSQPAVLSIRQTSGAATIVSTFDQAVS